MYGNVKTLFSGYGEKETILDTLLDQMEELMTNLQHIIEERSVTLRIEKLYSEELLSRLLPQYVLFTVSSLILKTLMGL